MNTRLFLFNFISSIMMVIVFGYHTAINFTAISKVDFPTIHDIFMFSSMAAMWVTFIVFCSVVLWTYWQSNQYDPIEELVGPILLEGGI